MSGAPTEHGTGELDESAFLESREGQLRLWRMSMRARYVALVSIALLALLPVAGPHRFWIAAALALVVIPYNYVYDARMRRTHHLSPIVAFSDQVVVVAFLAYAPELVAPILLVMLSINATSAVSFGRKVAAEGAAVGWLGVAGVLWASGNPAHGWASFLVYALASAFIITVVGGIAAIERDVRGRYVDLMGGIDAVVWEQLTHAPTTLYVNRRATDIIGYPAESWTQPHFWHEHVHPDDRDWVAQQYRQAVKAGRNTEIEYRFVRPDGTVVWLQDRMRVEVDSANHPTSVRGVMVDVTARKVAEEQTAQYLNLVQHVDVALFVFALADPEDHLSLTLLAINPVGARLVSPSALPGSPIGRRLLDIAPDLDAAGADLVCEALTEVIHKGEGFRFDEMRFDPTDPNATIFTANVFPLPGGSVGVSLQDVTEQVTSAAGLRRQALHDGLTGLPNRSHLTDLLRRSLRRSSQTLEPVALLVMDLDQFKEINDALGHDHGDRLLIELSRRLQDLLGATAEVVARLGGDEFAVLLTTPGDLDTAGRAAVAIRDALEQPFHLGGISLQVNASIGIAVYPEHAVDGETLARRADVAMYTAKRTGGGVAVYAPEHDQSSIRRLSLLGELRRAIAEDELVLHFQPSVDLATGEVLAAEALVRWMHPVHGLMPPGEFIELAEVSGSIQALTRWVLERAVTTVRAWFDEGVSLPVAVNLSVRNLYDLDLPVWLGQLLADHGVDASMLILEITESVLMDDPTYAMEVMGKLKALGVATSIDDFGTGYSSLAYLKNLPIDELKIDRSFVGTMVTDGSDLTIVRSIIDLSHNLGLDVVAEGVEDAETLAQLAEMGCDRAQGYYLSRPVPSEELLVWLSSTDHRDEVRTVLSQASARRWRAI
jgi:diguanylate cyclase (GGDEF)-like protein/PAS domain S-box-containing protein